jgi:hypothetical protein
VRDAKTPLKSTDVGGKNFHPDITVKKTKSETAKNIAATSKTVSNPSIKNCINVQGPPDQSKAAQISPSMSVNEGEKNFHHNAIIAPKRRAHPQIYLSKPSS